MQLPTWVHTVAGYIDDPELSKFDRSLLVHRALGGIELVVAGSGRTDDEMLDTLLSGNPLGAITDEPSGETTE